MSTVFCKNSRIYADTGMVDRTTGISVTGYSKLGRWTDLRGVEAIYGGVGPAPLLAECLEWAELTCLGRLGGKAYPDPDAECTLIAVTSDRPDMIAVFDGRPTAIWTHRPHLAIGTGAAIIMGALGTGASVSEAQHVASEIDMWTSSEWESIALHRDEQDNPQLEMDLGD